MTNGTDSCKLLTEQEVADILGLSCKTLQQWRYLKKNLAYHKIGKIVRYRLEDINTYINGNLVPAER